MKTEDREKQEYLEWKQLCASRGWHWKLYRHDIINHFIELNNYVNYLEIGVHNGTCIRKINALHKDGVDPGIETNLPPEVNYPITSDEFFALINGHDIKYDIIFIDGLHHDYQVYKDIKNSLNHLTPYGTIICHDMNPMWEIVQRKERVVGAWNGDCWKAWIKLRNEVSDITMQVVDTDNGVGIIQFGKQTCISLDTDAFDLTYDYLDDNRKYLLNLISIDEFYEKYKI
jgi:hypothetical protein